MQNVYSVGQVNNYIKRIFDEDFLLRRIYVKGEVSNCKYHTSGHVYFSLKDETGSIACVMFAGSRKGLAFSMKNGQSVIVLGKVNVYPRDGKYQMYADEIVLDGAGLLYEKYEALKQELEEMGMFAPEYKQPIPTYIRTLGIVTAPTGAAIRDIMNIAYRRNPYIQLILYPALVQGEGAASSIVSGIRVLEQAGVDAMIVGRGGGSIEDLWAFNEEEVARAIFHCSVPIISAVGHETDFTIADFVADLRAPTPSAAAELAVVDMAALLENIRRQEYQIRRLMQNRLDDEKLYLKRMQQRLDWLSPQNQICEKRQLLMDKEEKLQNLMEQILQKKRHEMRILAERMKGLSPLEKLCQGYAYASDEQGKKVSSIDQIKSGDLLQIYVKDGRILTEVKAVDSMNYQNLE